jgi:phosphoribosyl-AMP cyclohydrolase / phosphoribosyl-ATP pyrophosphohydrolase
MTKSLDLDALDFGKGAGLVTVVAVDAVDGAVLMVAHADREALERTLETGEMHYHSRTRGLWHKGATSGHIQRVVSLSSDCDGDAVLAVVETDSPSCHLETRSCFGDDIAAGVLGRLDALIAYRKAARPEGSYTTKLLGDRNLRLKKIGEEATELVVATHDADPSRVAEEAADLLFHVLVALRASDVALGDVLRVLDAREV